MSFVVWFDEEVISLSLYPFQQKKADWEIVYWKGLTWNISLLPEEGKTWPIFNG